MGTRDLIRGLEIEGLLDKKKTIILGWLLRFISC